MKDNVIEIKPERPSRWVNGPGGFVRKVDGARGLVTLQLIEIFEDCAEAFGCDYAELTVADIFEYLVEWDADTDRRMNQRR